MAVAGLGTLDVDTANALTKDGITDVPGLIQQFMSQKQYLGNAIRPPGPDAPESDKAAFYAKLQTAAPNLIPRPDKDDSEATTALAIAMGRPEKIEGYKMPELANANEDQLATFRAKAFEAGLTQNQLDTLITAEYDRTVEVNTREGERHSQDMKNLSAEWGVTYEKRVEGVTKFAELTGAPADLVELLKSGQIGSAALKWFHSLSTNLSGESNELRLQPNEENLGNAPGEAKLQAAEILKRLSKMQPSDPEYQPLMKKRMALMSEAYPDASQGLSTLRAGVQIGAQE